LYRASAAAQKEDQNRRQLEALSIPRNAKGNCDWKLGVPGFELAGETPKIPALPRDMSLVLSETTTTSMPASSMNEMLVSLDHRSGAIPPMGVCAFSVACQKKSGNIW
jgi:hypothetical protein